MDRTMLNKATSADDTPTPGYMYGEIAKMTYAGDTWQLEEYLTKKLQKDNPFTKHK